MKRSDVGFAIMMYALMAIFLIPLLSYPPSVRIYPMVILSLFFIMTTIYIINAYRQYRKTKEIEEDLRETFAAFIPRQFLIVLGLILVYIILVPIIGFYITTAIYLALSLFALKVKPIQIGLTLVFFFLLLYGVFTLFLRVPLPKGFLF